MINKIGVVSNIKPYNTMFKSEQKKVVTSGPNYETNNKGLEALAVYNKSYTEELNIKPIPLILEPEKDIDDILGEKIYNSEGKLHSIVNNE